MFLLYFIINFFITLFVVILISNVFYIDCSGLIKTWHVATQKVLSTIKEKRQTLTSELSTTNQYLITAGKSDQLNQYDLETNKLVKTFEPR